MTGFIFFGLPDIDLSAINVLASAASIDLAGVKNCFQRMEGLLAVIFKKAGISRVLPIYEVTDGLIFQPGFSAFQRWE